MSLFPAMYSLSIEINNDRLLNKKKMHYAVHLLNTNECQLVF